MHALRYMHAVEGAQLCCHSLGLIKIVHYARQYGARYHDCTAANECFEVHIREESQTSSQLHAWKMHDELSD